MYRIFQTISAKYARIFTQTALIKYSKSQKFAEQQNKQKSWTSYLIAHKNWPPDRLTLAPLWHRCESDAYHSLINSDALTVVATNNSIRINLL